MIMDQEIVRKVDPIKMTSINRVGAIKNIGCLGPWRCTYMGRRRGDDMCPLPLDQYPYIRNLNSQKDVWTKF